MQVSRINNKFPSNPVNINTIIFGFVLICLINYFINKCCRNRRIKELFWGSVGRFFTETAQVFASGVSDIAYTTGDWIQDTSYKIGDGVKHVSYKIGEGTELVASGALNVMISVNNVFIDALEDTIEGLKTFGYELGDMAKEVGRTMGQVAILIGSHTGATAFLNAFVDTLSNISQSVINAIKDMLDPCYWAMNYACPLLLHGLVLSIQAATAPAAATTEATFMSATAAMKTVLQTMWNQATTGNKGVISSTAHKLVGAVITPIVTPMLLVMLGAATGSPSYITQITSSITLLVTHVLVSQLLFGTKGLSYTYFIVEFLGAFMCDGKIFGIELANFIPGFRPYGAILIGCAAKPKPNIGKTDAQMEQDKISRDNENNQIGTKYDELQSCVNDKRYSSLKADGSLECACKYGGQPKGGFSMDCNPKTNRVWNATTKKFDCKPGTVDDGNGNCECPKMYVGRLGMQSGKYCGDRAGYKGGSKCEYPKWTSYGTLPACCSRRYYHQGRSKQDEFPVSARRYYDRRRRRWVNQAAECRAPSPPPPSRNRYRGRRRYYR